jgi:hypothetical protein
MLLMEVVEVAAQDSLANQVLEVAEEQETVRIIMGQNHTFLAAMRCPIQVRVVAVAVMADGVEQVVQESSFLEFP